MPISPLGLTDIIIKLYNPVRESTSRRVACKNLGQNSLFHRILESTRNILAGRRTHLYFCWVSWTRSFNSSIRSLLSFLAIRSPGVSTTSPLSPRLRLKFPSLQINMDWYIMRSNLHMTNLSMTNPPYCELHFRSPRIFLMYFLCTKTCL